MTIVLQFYPNGEFSQGVDTSASRREKKERRHRITERRDAGISAQTSRYAEITASIPADKIESPGTQYRNRRGDVLTVLHSCDEGVTLAREVDGVGSDVYTTKYSIYDMISRGELTPLVYQMVENSNNRPNRKKLVGMTKNMGRNIRNAAYLLERQPGGKDVLSFLTLTLPSLSHEGLQLCCENWDSMVNQFLTWLRVTLKRKHIDFQYVYCTEIQTKRLEKRHEYAPHIHIIFRGRDGRKHPWVITPKQARKAWSRCIRSFVSEPFDASAVENLQRVKRSAGRYLSKYMSKGNTSIPPHSEGEAVEGLRTQWGGMARSLAKSIRKCTQRIASSFPIPGLGVCILRHMAELVDAGLVRYWSQGFICLSGSPTDGTGRGLHVGAGCLQTPTYEGGLTAVIQFISGSLNPIPHEEL